MAYRPRHTHQNHVRFSEDDYPSYTAGAKMETVAGAYGERPHFPNLGALFTSREVPMDDDQKFGNIAAQKARSQAVAHVQEDVNMEASDFIKRKHHSLELQKRMSMKGSNYYT